jgi:Recombinase
VATTIPVLRSATCIGAREHRLEWKPPTYQWLLHLLQKPIYAGAYVYGRRAGQISLRDGRKRIVYTRVRDPSQWTVLIREHHEGYISWETFEHNQHVLTRNANILGERVQGPSTAARRFWPAC